MRTMNAVLGLYTLPDIMLTDCLGTKNMELSHGIHEELSAVVAEGQPADVVVSHVLKQILSKETNYLPITQKW